MGKIRILSTKKLRTHHKQFLLNAGLAVIEADFINIQPKPFAAEGIAPNLIFTSANGFRSFMANNDSEKFKKNNVFCVGSATKHIIANAGFTVVASADYAAELAKIITREDKGKTFTFFCGSMRRDTLPEALAEAGIAFNEIEVYDTNLSPHKINTPVDGILFYSPSGVESYLKVNTINTETCFCIGTTTADPLKGITDNIVIANKPTVENVIVRCINYYKNYTTTNPE